MKQRYLNLILGLFVLWACLGPVAASEPRPARTQANAVDVDEQLVFQRAVEAVIWSMPAISDVYFRESLFRDFAMAPGDVIVMSRPLAARHEVLTANNQVNYAGAAFDLGNGPVVIEVPPSNGDYAIIGQICDNWQAPVTMVGVPGPDGGKGGRYLLLPPGFKGQVPEGHIAVPLEGFRGTLVFRPVVIGQGTMAGSVALARSTQLYPLADAARPRATRIVDGWDRPWHSLPVYDSSWFDHLARFVNDEPIRERDKVMIGMLATLGIEHGKPFAPDARMRKVLDDAARRAYEIMQHGFVTPGRALAAWWPDRRWMNLNPALAARMGEAWSFTTANAVFAYDRAIAPYFWANYLPKKLGGDQLFLMGLHDSRGALLSGKSRYRLRVPADVPVDKFWSVIVYSQKTKSFIPNARDQIGIDSYGRSKLTTNADGSVDIYLGNAAPAGLDSNWLPSDGEDFFVIFRLYGPARSVYERTWKAPDIERID